MNEGARAQRLLFASTGTKDPKASDVLYVKALAAPLTVDTMPEDTLLALADHGKVGAVAPADGGDCEAVLGGVQGGGRRHRRAGEQLQNEGADVVRQVVERADGGDRGEERSAAGRRDGAARRRSGACWSSTSAART